MQALASANSLRRRFPAAPAARQRA